MSCYQFISPKNYLYIISLRYTEITELSIPVIGGRQKSHMNYSFITYFKVVNKLFLKKFKLIFKRCYLLYICTTFWYRNIFQILNILLVSEHKDPFKACFETMIDFFFLYSSKVLEFNILIRQIWIFIHIYSLMFLMLHWFILWIFISFYCYQK